MISQQYLLIAIVILLSCSIIINIYILFFIKKRYSEEKTRSFFPAHVISDPELHSKIGKKIRKRVVLLGDSRIAQWNNLPNIDGFEFIRSGISGETSAQLRLRIEQDVLPLKPDYVILQIGINDLIVAGIEPKLEKRITDQLRDNYQYIFKILNNIGIQIILLTIIASDSPPLYRLPFWSSRIPALVGETNRWFVDVAQRYNVILLDSDKILSQKGQIKTIYKDTLHLNADGYFFINQAIESLFFIR